MRDRPQTEAPRLQTITTENIMRQPVILQISRLGIPVLIDGQSGSPELRWSCDPDIKADAPAYLFRESVDIKDFLSFAIDKSFITESSLLPIRVNAPDDAVTMSREEAQRQGVSSDNWDSVRVGMIISGNTSKGPVSDALEWYGEREEYGNGVHVMAAFQYAKSKDISSPTIVPHNESSHTLVAAEFMTSFHHTIKPQLLNAHQVLNSLKTDLRSLDLETLNPDRALQILKQIKSAFSESDAQEQLLRTSLGMEVTPMPVRGADVVQPAQTPESIATAHAAAPAPDPAPDSSLFRSPRLG